MEQRNERRKIIGAVLASIIVHFIVAFSIAAVGSVPASLPEMDRPLELTFVDLAPTPPPVPKTGGFIDTSRESAEAPKEKTFESHANSIAASERDASGPLPIPSQDGRERPSMDVDTHQYSLSAKGAAPEPQVQPQPSAAPQPTAKPLPTLTPIETPKPTATPATPPPTATPAPTATPKPVPTATPESEQFAMLTATPPPAIQPQAEEFPDQRTETSTPLPTIRPKPDVPSTAYRPQREKARLSGSVSNRGVAAVNAVGTPLGRYQKLLYDAVGSRWYFYIEKQRDLVSIGTVRVRFSVDRTGRVKNLKVVENTSNESFANVCLQSVLEVQLPPIPEDVAGAIPGEGLETDMNFTIFANR